jgi:hypothetical protein
MKWPSRSPGPSSPEPRGATFAWKVHSAITDWTAKVDAKASISLALESAIFGFVITLSSTGRVLDNLQGSRLLLFRGGLLALGAGIVLAALVVMPRLGRATAKRVWHENLIYFGHLRHWDPVQLSKRLTRLDEEAEVEMLARQLVSTSKIAWFKHVCLQASIIIAFVGAACIALAGWPR